MIRWVVLAALAACHPVSDHAAQASPIPSSTTELVTAVARDWTATTVELRRWHREDAKATWRAVGEPWPGVIGRRGIAWGAGLHGDGAPAPHDGPLKREGDGKSPAGVFAIRGSYGYAAAPPDGTHVAYTTVDANWQCVDDVASAQYARIVDRRTVAVDWKSAELMRRPDVLYTWVVDIAHNAARTPRAGSCIFWHVWSGPDSATAGCTAMPESVLANLVATIPSSTVFVQLPRSAYAALGTAWNLPPL